MRVPSEDSIFITMNIVSFLGIIFNSAFLRFFSIPGLILQDSRNEDAPRISIETILPFPVRLKIISPTSKFSLTTSFSCLLEMIRLSLNSS